MKPLSPFPQNQTQLIESPAVPEAYWNLTAEQLLAGPYTTCTGIQQIDAENRIKQYGHNTLKAQRKKALNSNGIHVTTDEGSPKIQIEDLIFLK